VILNREAVYPPLGVLGKRMEGMFGVLESTTSLARKTRMLNV
jgi:hypothetical protein